MRRRLRKPKSTDMIKRSKREEPSFNPDLSGRPCIVLEKRSDHMIRMNYIRYIKTQVQEMQIKDSYNDQDDTIDYTFK
jgi:hypothetical protein